MYRYKDNENIPIGYRANIGITVILSELDEVENVVSGLVDAGVNEIKWIEFQTTKLRELRSQARKLATEAAREKAESYAAAGNVSLGEVLHIQDVNPRVLEQAWSSHVPRSERREIADSEPEQTSFDPSAIEVGAAVLVAYRIAA